MSSPEFTPSQVKKAGRTLRRSIRGEDVDLNVVREALILVDNYRAAHQLPLVKANNGLRSMVRTCGYPVKVSQRLKRFPTILEKLSREPTLSLSKMQDIGGCRAVLPSIEAVRAVEQRVTRQRPPVHYSDYITHPRVSGYRGVHLVVVYDDRWIEIQLRTAIMHEWAFTVEKLSSRVGQNLKGDGEHAVQVLMAAISEAMALEECSQEVPTELQSRIVTLRRLADPYLTGGR